jgi:hypothetical protein
LEHFVSELNIQKQVTDRNYLDFLRKLLAAVCISKESGRIYEYVGTATSKSTLSKPLYEFIIKNYYALVKGTLDEPLSTTPGLISLQHLTLEDFSVREWKDEGLYVIPIDSVIQFKNALSDLSKSDPVYGFQSLNAVFRIFEYLKQKHSGKRTAVDSILRL